MIFFYILLTPPHFFFLQPLLLVSLFVFLVGEPHVWTKPTLGKSPWYFISLSSQKHSLCLLSMAENQNKNIAYNFSLNNLAKIKFIFFKQ